MPDVYLYTFPQWFVFASIFIIIYGWVEQKKIFQLIGISSFVALGIFSVYIINANYLEVANYLTPEEVASKDLEDHITQDIPIQVKILPAYWLFILTSIFAIPTLFATWKEKKLAKPLIILTSLLALAGFFVIVGAIQSI